MYIRALILLIGLLLHPLAVWGSEPDWWLVQRNLTAALTQSGTNLATLVKQVSQATPTNGETAMFRLCVFTRAGMNQAASQTLPILKRLCPELPSYQVSSIYYDACDHLQARDLAQATLEVFADNVSQVSLDNRLIKHWLESGWSVQRVDQWLAARPKGRQNFWVKERLHFNVEHGQGQALQEELAQRVRANPTDATEALSFLDALEYARSGQPDQPNLAWVGTTIHPALATQASEIGSHLARLQNWKTTVVFYRQAITNSLTPDEVRRLQGMTQVFLPEPKVRASFAAQTREALADCLLKLGEPTEAQKWMLEAAELREKNQLGRNTFFAGQVQAASGQRAVEERFKAREAVSEKEPQYWYERAQYYRGRKEPAQQEAALKHGLALATPQPEPARPFKGFQDWRSLLLADYAHFLQQQKRESEAIALLRKELELSPPNAESARRAAYLLVFDFEKQTNPEDAVLWNWLEHRPKWEYTEERLLWRMLEKASGEQLDQCLARAEKLALNHDPSRALTLGWVENRMHCAQRSIPLLEYAVEQAQEPELKERATFSLFESYLNTGDWKQAEQLLPQAGRRLTYRELPEWYSRIAVMAGKAGAKADAMRIWSRVANLDLTATAGVEPLAKAGLKEELIAFYRETQKAMPTSEIRPKVLAQLQAQ